MSIERIYVEHDIYDEFCEKLAEVFQSQKIGGALDWKTRLVRWSVHASWRLCKNVWLMRKMLGGYGRSNYGCK